MKKMIRVFLVVSILALSAGSAHAERYYHGGHRWGPGWGPVIGLGVGVGLWELSHPYYLDYYNPPPVVIQQQPDVYIQQAPQPVPVPVQEPVYWYYCQDPQGYYPYVKQCPQGWMKVVPTPPAPR